MQFNSYQEQEDYHKKMDEIKKRREEREDAMSFLDYIKLKQEEIERISHKDRSDKTYHDCQELIHRIQYRFIIEYNIGWDELHKPLADTDLKHTESKLDSYKHCRSERDKREVINTFISYLKNDLRHIIADKENGQSTPL